jgi:hypothetical protein
MQASVCAREKAYLDGRAASYAAAVRHDAGNLQREKRYRRQKKAAEMAAFFFA